MQFGTSDEQQLLQSTLRDFLAKECTPEFVRAGWESETGRSQELWRQLAELGLPGLLVDEALGGLGLDETSLVLLLEETGRAALAEPVIASAAVAAPLLRELDRPEFANAWLEKLAAGQARIAVGHPANAFLADAHVADLLLLFRPGELHALAPAEATLTREAANDPSRRLHSISWTPREESRIAHDERATALAAQAFERGALACAAEALGVADRMIELAVAYAGSREQFGRPIGSFQAIKHMLADVKVKLEYSRPLVHRAAWSVAQALPSRGLHVSMAKLAACEAAGAAARSSLQVHGAIGYTWEQDLHIWMRRAWSLDLCWGRREVHERRVREVLLDGRTPTGPGTTFEGGQ
ncbi:MAG: acyl-CoA dehydrogenase family protein [Myxococcota bacterium]